jgi:hypothetical protein
MQGVVKVRPKEFGYASARQMMGYNEEGTLSSGMTGGIVTDDRSNQAKRLFGEARNERDIQISMRAS